ncbi:LysE family translocator [Sinosporangium siamense]|uniref:LysE family translocator n=1 Tax=Sinosporangium siamense TaxID=1367973 RepID=UPI0035EE137F
MTQGRTAGIVSAMGIAIGTVVHIAAAAAGVSYVIAQSATLFAVLKWAGVAYLAYLGVRTLLAGDQPHEQAVVVQPLWRVFAEGLLVNVLNPKTVLFFLAFLPQFVVPAVGPVAGQVVVFGLLLMLVGMATDVVYAVAAGALSGWLRRWARGLRWFSGAVYLGLGVVMAFTGRRPV